MEPFWQHGVQDVQLLALRAGANAEHRGEDKEHGARSPGLWRARDGIVHRLIVFAALHSAKKFGKAVVAKVHRRLEERGQGLLRGLAKFVERHAMRDERIVMRPN